MNEQRLGPSDEQPGIDPAALTDREREVIELALAGLSARSIAGRLSLGEATVRSHLSRIYAKLGVAGRVELLARLKGPLPAELGRLTPTPTDVVASHGGRRGPARRSAVLAVGIVALGLGLVFAVLRPDLPPTTDLPAVSRLVSDRQVTSLDLRGGTLFVTTADGSRYRVEGADPAAIRALQAAAVKTSTTVDVSGGGDSLVATVAMMLNSLVPIALIVLAILLGLRRLRRPPRPRPAG